MKLLIRLDLITNIPSEFVRVEIQFTLFNPITKEMKLLWSENLSLDDSFDKNTATKKCITLNSEEITP